MKDSCKKIECQYSLKKNSLFFYLLLFFIIFNSKSDIISIQQVPPQKNIPNLVTANNITSQNLYIKHFSTLYGQDQINLIISKHQQISQAFTEIQNKRQQNLLNVKNELQNNYPQAWNNISKYMNNQNLASIPATQNPFWLISILKNIIQSILPNAIALIKQGKNKQALNLFTQTSKLNQLISSLNDQLDSQSLLRKRLHQIIQLNTSQSLSNIFKSSSIDLSKLPPSTTDKFKILNLKNQSQSSSYKDQLIQSFGKQIVDRYLIVSTVANDKIKKIDDNKNQIQKWFKSHPQIYKPQVKFSGLQTIKNNIQKFNRDNRLIQQYSQNVPFNDLVLLNKYHTKMNNYFNNDNNNFTLLQLHKWSISTVQERYVIGLFLQLVNLRNQFFKEIMKYTLDYYYTQIYDLMVLKRHLTFYLPLQQQGDCKPQRLTHQVQIQGKIFFGNKQITWDDVIKILFEKKYSQQIQSNIIKSIFNGRDKNNKPSHNLNEGSTQWKQFLAYSQLTQEQIQLKAQKFPIYNGVQLVRGIQKIQSCHHTLFILNQADKTTLLIA